MLLHGKIFPGVLWAELRGQRCQVRTYRTDKTLGRAGTSEL